MVTKGGQCVCRVVSSGTVGGGEVVIEARPYRAVSPDKEFQFYSSAKESHWKVLTRGVTKPVYSENRLWSEGEG